MVNLKEQTTLEYKIWQDMMAKCYDKRHPEYSMNGGKGIQVCKEWHDYNKFLKDIGRCPK